MITVDVKANGTSVLTVTSSGIEVKGKGTIAGWKIEENGISKGFSNGLSYNGTSTYEIALSNRKFKNANCCGGGSAGTSNNYPGFWILQISQTSA